MDTRVCGCNMRCYAWDDDDDNYDESCRLLTRFLFSKFIHTILANPSWGDWYPVPAVDGEVRGSGEQPYSSSGSIPVPCLHACLLHFDAGGDWRG